MWPATLDMASEALPLGVGAGNFVARFPAYRDPKEIEISTFGHQFGTAPQTPHNDPLHLFAELGIGGVLLLILGLVSLGRLYRRRELEPLALAGLAAFLPLTLFRSPFWNAPAAVALLTALWLGTPRSEAETGRATQWTGRILAIGLLALGVVILLGESFGAGFFRAKRLRDAPGGTASLERAMAIDVFEPKWRLLHSQIHHPRRRPVSANRLPEVVADLRYVLGRRPDSYRALAEMGDLGVHHPELREEGRRSVARLVELDPGHPEGLYLAAEYAFMSGQFTAGILALARLGQRTPIEAKLRLMEQATHAEADPRKKVQYAAVQLELRKLLRKLFPNDRDR
jgi:cytochrome c-type biogenesis protein CcmH/NrfG